MTGAAIPEVIAIYRGDYNVLQLHVVNGFSQAVRLIFVHRQRAAVSHVTEGTTPGADFTKDHERGRTLGKTLVDVGAGRFLADRDQIPVSESRFQIRHSITRRQAHANPRWLTQARSIGVEIGRVSRHFLSAKFLCATDPDSDPVGLFIALAQFKFLR
jgi:hypothetical protein